MLSFKNQLFIATMLFLVFVQTITAQSPDPGSVVSKSTTQTTQFPIWQPEILAYAPPDEPALEDATGTDGHDHTHDGLHFSHPLMTESPSPDTKLRFDYIRGHSDEGDEDVFRLGAEYAFSRGFSIEAEVPYVFLNPEEEASLISVTPK